jgi:hypothetical protein
MADADTVSHQLVLAGFDDIALRRCDIPYVIGRDLDEAVSYNMALGPAGEVIRLSGADADRIRPQIEAALRAALNEFETPQGVIGASSTWIVTARAAPGSDS